FPAVVRVVDAGRVDRDALGRSLRDAAHPYRRVRGVRPRGDAARRAPDQAAAGLRGGPVGGAAVLRLRGHAGRDHRGGDAGGGAGGGWRGGGSGPAAARRASSVRGGPLRDGLVRLGLISETFGTAVTWDRFWGFDEGGLAATRQPVSQACGGGVVSCRFAYV